VYTGCVHDCGWSVAGIPPLADITNACNGDNAANSVSPYGSPWPTPAPTDAGSGGDGGGGGGGGGGQQGAPITFTTVVKTGDQPKNTGSGNSGTSNGNGNHGGTGNSNGNDATSGVDDKEDEHGVLFRVESVIITGVAVLWMAGWL
jgi:hypothetical protein